MLAQRCSREAGLKQMRNIENYFRSAWNWSNIGQQRLNWHKGLLFFDMCCIVVRLPLFIKNTMMSYVVLISLWQDVVCIICCCDYFLFLFPFHATAQDYVNNQVGWNTRHETFLPVCLSVLGVLCSCLCHVCVQCAWACMAVYMSHFGFRHLFRNRQSCGGVSSSYLEAATHMHTALSADTVGGR